MKRLLLFIALLISGLGLNAQSVGSVTTINYGNYTLVFTITNLSPAECRVWCTETTNTTISIPSIVTIDGLECAVTAIAPNAFYRYSLTSIEIPSGVTSIGESAFYGCSSLTSIEIPSGVTSIEKSTFRGCSSLTSIEIPSGVTSIGESAFRGCSSLTSIEIPSGVTSIGKFAFNGCSSLTNIEIPSGVTSIGSNAFGGCSSLTNIEIPSGVTSIGESAFYGCSSLTNIEIPSGVTSIGESAFYGCSSLTSIEVPSEVTVIGDNAFDGCSSLTSIEIPNGVTTIGDHIFYGCSNLTNIEMPSGVTTIGDYVFYGCSSLTSIEIPSGVTYIGDYVFYGCSSLTNIEIPSGVTSIGKRAFFGCSSLTNIEMPSGVTSIGEVAFYGCSSLTNIEIPSGVTSIGSSTFYGCSSLTNIEIPSGVTYIGDYVFYGCSNLTNIEIPSGVTSIGDYVFYGCSNLTNIEIPSGVTSIGEFAFYGCSSLTSIEIPSGVTSIESATFYGCSSLTNIEIPNSVTFIGSDVFWYCLKLGIIKCFADNVPIIESNYDVFFECPSDMIIYVPENSVELYELAECWNKYTIKSNVSLYTTIIDYDGYSLEFKAESVNQKECAVFCSTKPIEGMLVSLPSKVTILGIEFSVTSIGESAFYGCSSLTSIEIPSSVTSIGESAFNGCSNLSSATLGENSHLTYIGNNAFYGCSSLTNIEIPSGVTSIGDYAFYGCSSLTSIDFGENSQLTSIGDYAFYECSSLTSIEIPSGVTSIGDYAFYYCSSLTSIEIPSGVTSIGNLAFARCANLREVLFGEDAKLTTIGGGCFYRCLDLKYFKVPNGVVSLVDAYGALNHPGVFEKCISLRSVDVSNVTSIGKYCFSGCVSLRYVVYSGNCPSVGYNSFAYCDKYKLISSSDCTIVEQDGYSLIFHYTYFTKVGCYKESSDNFTITIPSEVKISGKEMIVTTIDNYAFNDCSNLIGVEIPNSITDLGIYAFNNCPKLTFIKCCAENVPDTDENAIKCSSYTKILVPSVSLSEYRTTSPWNNYNIVGISDENDLYTINEYEGYSLIFNVTNVESAECNVRCNKVSSAKNISIVIPSKVIISGNEYTVTSIESYAFDNCQNLKSIEIPNSVISIGECAFRECFRLMEVMFEENTKLVSIGGGCFYRCSSLKNLKIPYGVISLPAKNIKIDEGEYVGYGMFNGCYNLTNIEIPNSVTSIGDWAFYGCSSLTSIEIPSSVTSIGGYAFPSSLANIYCYSESVPGASLAFGNSPSDMVIYVPENSVELYKSSKRWKDFIILPLPSCNVTVVVNQENAGIVVGAGKNPQNGIVKLVAIPNEGYKFVNWTENGEVISIDAEYMFKLTCDKEFVANFTLLDYDVILSVNNEAAGFVTGAGNYNHGEEIALIATPNEYYKFVNWTEDGEVVSTDAEYSFTITSDRNLVANFELLTYEVVVSANNENFGTLTGAGTYSHGDEVTLTATENEGCKFVNWTENGEVVSTDAVYAFTITGDRNLVANFELLTYEVVVSANNENFGTVTGAGTYSHGDEVKLIAVPNETYKFVNWTENGEVVSEEVEYTFTITGNRNLVANFSLLDYDVILSVNNEAAGSVTGAGNYHHGEEVTLTATANEGYEFLNWTENDIIVSIDAEYLFEITKDRNLVANFEKIEEPEDPEQPEDPENPEDPEQPEEPGEGVEELTSSFNIYPNPVNDKLYIETQTQTLTVEIYDIYGRQQSMVNGQQSTVIDVTNLNSGVYFVKVVSSEGEAVKRIVKK